MRYHFPSASLALICAAACNDIPTRPMSTEPLDAAMTKVVGSSFTMLSISAQSACGVEKKGQIYCWGLNNFGQLGDGTSDFFSPIPRAVAVAGKFKHVSTNYTHGCGVTRQDEAFCWGYNGSGQLGAVTSQLISNVPVPVSGGYPFSRVAVGAAHSCGLRSDPLGPADGLAYCWGDNAGGRLGINTVGGTFSSPQQVFNYGPVPIGGGGFPALRFYTLEAGVFSTCGLSEGYDPYTFVPTNAPAYWQCWGANSTGHFGDGNHGVHAAVPVTAFINLAPLSIHPFTYEGEHLCVVGADGANPSSGSRAYCAGLNQDAQLGDGSTTWSSLMIPVQGGGSFKTVSAGSTHSCGLTAQGAAYCWGNNDRGQFGNGTLVSSATPVAVSTSLRFAQIYAANLFTCALTAQGEAHCWGRNELGELGDGTTIDRLTPTPLVVP